MRIWAQIREAAVLHHAPRLLQTIGLFLVAGSLVAFFYNHPTTGTILALLSILVLWARELPEPAEALLSQTGESTSHQQSWILLVFLLFVAIFFRIFQLGELPWGINNDAAWNGIYALRFLDGEAFSPFTAECWGKETMFMYLLAFSFKLFGVSRTTLLLPGILAGIATVFGTFLLARRLFGTRFAYLSALLLAGMGWHVVLSRTGYRAILSPLCLVMTLWLFYRAVDCRELKARLMFYVLAGIFIGLGLNTYFSFRGVPILIVILTFREWATDRKFLRQNWHGFMLMVLTAFVICIPLFWYGIYHWKAFMGRSNFLFVGNKIKQAGSWQPLWDNLDQSLLIFHYKARVGNFFAHHIPILSRLLGFFFLAGLGTQIRHIGRRGPFVVLAMLFFGHLGSLLSEPDATRSLMITVPIAMISAGAILTLLRFLPRAGTSLRWAIPLAVTGLVLVAEFHFFFLVLGNDFGAQFGYARKHTLIGYKGEELSKKNEAYVSQGHFMDTVKFLVYRVPGEPLAITDGKVIHYVEPKELRRNLDRVLAKPRVPGKGLAFVFEATPRNTPLLERVRQVYPTGVLANHTDSRYGKEPIYSTYVIPPEEFLK